MSPLQSRRALVLTTEGARHPFRRSLPPRVFVPLRDESEEGEERGIRTMIAEEWRSFVGTYCAAFVAVVVFLA
jgi:hypothetical protein